MSPRQRFEHLEVTSRQRLRASVRHPRPSRGRLIGPGLEALERREVPAVLAIVAPNTNPVGQTFTAGTPFAGQIATFVANDGATDGTRYQATIDWGDSSSSPGTVVYDASSGNFDIDAAHTYRAPAQTAIVVQVDDFWDATHNSQSANLTVLDQALTPTATEPVIAGVIQGAPIASQDVFTFTDGNPLALASDFTATIHWGDGTATAADSIAKDADGVYHVLGSHTYQHPAPTGGYQLTATVSDGPSMLAVANAIAVAPAPLLLGASPVALAVTSANTQGQAIIPAGTVVGSFTQAGLPDPAASYMTAASFARFAGSLAATPLTVSVPATAGGTFVVTTAADTVVAPFFVPGSTPFALQVADQVAGVLAVAQGQLEMADVPPVATMVQPTIGTTQGQVFAGPIATFTLPFGGTQDLSAQYTATVDWGDGTAPTTGLIQLGSTAGSYVVQGRHTYADIGAKLTGQAAGTDPISVTVRRLGMSGASQVIDNTAQVLDAPLALTVNPIALPVTASDATGRAVIPAGTVVGTFTQVGAARLTTAFAGSTATFPGAIAATPLSFTYDAASGQYTASTAAATPIPPFLVPGMASFSVQITDGVGGATAAGQAMLQIADVAPVVAAVQPSIALGQNATYTGPVATFALPFGLGQDLSGQYTATINWGDGSTPTAGTIQAGSTPGSYVVIGSHSYADIGAKLANQAAGTYAIATAVRRIGADGAAVTVADSATVFDAPITLATLPIALSVTSAHATGQAAIPAGTVVATFIQPAANRDASAFAGSTATFPGAASPTPLVVTFDAATRLFIARTAATTAISPFLTPGSASVAVRIADAVGGAAATGTTTLSVTDAAPVASSVQPTAAVTLGGTFSGPVASFALPFGLGQDLSGQYTATINWGDGSPPTAGAVVAGTTPGTYSVVGSHAYPGIGTLIPGQFAGTYPVTVAVQRVGLGGAGMTATNTVQVNDLPIAVTGSLVPASIAGIVRTALVTNSTTPTFAGTSEPNATITLYATMIGTSAVVPVGRATADASGYWTITTIPLGDGAYTMAATAVDAIGVASALGQILPNAYQGALSVQTASPAVASVRFNAKTGMVSVTYTDPEGPLALASLTNPAAYKITSGTSAAAVAMASPTVLAADPLGHSATVGIKLTHARQFRSNQIKVSIAGSAITDAAGNSLGGNFAATVRSNSSSQRTPVARVATAAHPQGPTAHAAKVPAAAHRHRG